MLTWDAEIDSNFNRAHRIVTTSILPLVEQYGEHSKAVWEATKVTDYQPLSRQGCMYTDTLSVLEAVLRGIRQCFALGIRGISSG